MELKIKLKSIAPALLTDIRKNGITKKQFLKYLDKNLGDRVFFYNKITRFGSFVGDVETTIEAFSKKTIKLKRKTK